MRSRFLREIGCGNLRGTGPVLYCRGRVVSRVVSAGGGALSGLVTASAEPGSRKVSLGFPLKSANPTNTTVTSSNPTASQLFVFIRHLHNGGQASSAGSVPIRDGPLLKQKEARLAPGL